MAVNVLLSFAFHGPGKLDTDLAAARRGLVCGRLMLDSGAFTAHRTGKPIRVADYAAWLERWRGCWNHAMTLDKIGDPEASRRQTHQLHARGLPVMPVFTIRGDLAEFDAMVRDCGYVAVGGIAGKGSASAARDRVAMLQRRAADAGGGIHALGMGNMASLRAARPYSADASVPSAAFLYGCVVYFDGRRIHSPGVGDRVKLTRDRDHITAQDIPLGLLLRARRLPDKQHRAQLMRAYSLTYAAADEQLKRTVPVPAPAGLPPGPQLYNSVTPDWGVLPAAAMDRQLHTGEWRPRAWQRYGGRHTCPAEEAA